MREFAHMLVFTLLSGCRTGVPETAKAEPPEMRAENPHRELARFILEEHCGTCHRADQPTAQIEALNVFTLNDMDWSRRMTTAQLENAFQRLEGQGVSNDDLTSFRRFIDAER